MNEASGRSARFQKAYEAATGLGIGDTEVANVLHTIIADAERV